MPTYTYGCKKCGLTFDVFHAMSATPKVKCEGCGSVRTERHLGTGAGFIFKGSGFYETDFKEKKGAPPKSESTADTKKEAAANATSDSSATSDAGSAKAEPKKRAKADGKKAAPAA